MILGAIGFIAVVGVVVGMAFRQPPPRKARSIGARGQFNQQAAMLSRPDSHADLERVRVPTFLMCGREDPVTPVQDHQAMAARTSGARLEIIESCGHLSTIEQPEVVNRVLTNWLRETEADSRKH